jgi:hypothetical protein
MAAESSRRRNENGQRGSVDRALRQNADDFSRGSSFRRMDGGGNSRTVLL